MDLSIVELEETSAFANELHRSCLSETNKTSLLELLEYVSNGHLEGDIRRESFSGLMFIYQESYIEWMQTHLKAVIERLIAEKTKEIFERNLQTTLEQSIRWVMDPKCAAPSFIPLSLLDKLSEVNREYCESRFLADLYLGCETSYETVTYVTGMIAVCLLCAAPIVAPVAGVTALISGAGLLTALGVTLATPLGLPIAVTLAGASLNGAMNIGQHATVTSTHYWWSSSEIFEHYLEATLSRLQSNFDDWGKELIKSFALEYEKKDEARHNHVLSQSQLLQSSLVTSGINFVEVHEDLKSSFVVE